MRPLYADPSIITKTFAFVANAGLIILPLFLLISEVSEKKAAIVTSVEKMNTAPDSVQAFPDAVILSAHTISITPRTTAMHLLAPREWTDPVYSFLFLLCAIVLVIFFWDFTYKNPFTKKALAGLWVLLVLLIAFLLANIFRYNWFDEQVRTITGNQYSFKRPLLFASAELWIMLALMRVVRIIHNGLRLQKEMNLTV